MCQDTDPIDKVNKPMLLPSAIMTTVLLLWSSTGCAHVPRCSEPISVAQYVASVDMNHLGSVETISIAPLGVHLDHGRYLSVDIAVEGPARQALRTARYLAVAARLRPDDWLEVVDPEGTKLRLTAAPMPRGQYTSIAAYSVRIGESRSRLLVQAWSQRGMFDRMRPGAYRVRLLENMEYLAAVKGEQYSVDTQWHEFEIFRGSIAPSPLRDRPQIYLPSGLRTN